MFAVIEGHWLLGNLLAWRSCCGCGGRFVWELFDEGERLRCGVSPYLSDSSFSSMEILRRRHTHTYHHNKQVVDNAIVSCTPKAQEDNTKCLNNGRAYWKLEISRKLGFYFIAVLLHINDPDEKKLKNQSKDSLIQSKIAYGYQSNYSDQIEKQKGLTHVLDDSLDTL
ncbi:hypothetical protein D5086_002735 [Populus alba]|uniref:Uncharacterized protein n=1 Tax=Populus alba TaxID=43335 RepID=A0ACC4D3V8_POPAL